MKKQEEQFWDDKKAERIKDKAVGVAEKLLEKAVFTAEHLKQVGEIAAQEAVERTLHERSASDSSVMAEVLALRKEMNDRMEAIENRLGNWKFGSIVAFWVLAGIGGLITWFINSFGVKLSLMK